MELAGHEELATCPDVVQIFTDICVSQYSVGMWPAKYSFFTVEPPGAQSQTPFLASFPDFVQMVAVTIESGLENVLFGKFV